MVDNAENILVEFDYQNISVIDPNKVIDTITGKAKERLINQEDLVYYANLECSVLPRTKLALGVPLEDSIRTISVGKINFLNPGEKKFLDNSYVDEITGKDSLQGKGINQQKQEKITNPNKSDDYFIRQTKLSEGKVGAVDTGMLGITQININYGTDFLPVIDITLEDIKGRALFEAGNNSPYSAFFQLPYPLFYLTIKGYLGKAVRLPLMIQTFAASFDPSTHNFRVQLRLYTYKYTILSHVNGQQMLSTPLMFQSSIGTIPQSATNNGSQNDVVKKGWSSRGFAKMRELYSEYKSKGLIEDTFPEITLQQLKINLNTFLKNIIENYPKANMDIINGLASYEKILSQYESEVYFGGAQISWFNKYLDVKFPFVTKPASGQKNGYVIYQFKKEYSDPEQRETALTELSGIVSRNNDLLAKNVVFGEGKPDNIPVDISVDLESKTSTFFSNATFLDLDVSKTYFERNKKELKSTDTASILAAYKGEFDSSTKFFFYGKNSFFQKLTTIRENYQTKKQKIEEKLSKEIILNLSKSASEGGIGFLPTIRNVLAVFFAQGEAFLRLLDEVHTKAWDLRDDDLRKEAVLSTASGANSVDLKDLSVSETPIYPWPQLIVQNNTADGEKYEIKYPGDISIASKIRAYQPEIWPEVEFVEEFLKATFERSTPQQFPTETSNPTLKPNRLSFNAVEFPINNQVFQNTEEIKFFYEIYERLLMNAFYSKLSRDSNKLFNMTQYYAEAEVLDMLQSLGDNNPFLTKKLKEYDLNSGVYLEFLKHISNGGSGESWQNYIRGVFVTPYIKNETENSFKFYYSDITDNEISQPLISIKDTSVAKNYFGDKNIVENYDFTDTYPITNLGWIQSYMANANELQKVEDVFKTNQVLEYNNINKCITNFDDVSNQRDKQPVTHFNYKNNNSGTFKQELDLTNLKFFYENRKYKQQYTTEGNVSYFDYENKLVSEQTTSMMNTPYFINSIIRGVNSYQYTINEPYPYKAAAFLFLNSLPLGTLREKYRQDNDGSATDLDYIVSTFKKYGAIHKLPYAWVLKYGAIWHRYKTFIENQTDILQEIWTDFDYAYYYDPLNSDLTKIYSLVIDGNPTEIRLQDNIFSSPFVYQTKMNVGFYPQLIDAFNIFFQGNKLFDTVVQITGTATINGNTLIVETISGNDLFDGAILEGTNIVLGTTITGQTSGTIGGVGEYQINIPQTATTAVSFVVTNPQVQSYSNSEIQSVIDDNILFVKNIYSASIFKPQGFDTNNPNRSLFLKSWSCYVSTPDNQFIYPIPSVGSTINQTNDECFNGGTLVTELEDNPAVFNGSVRMFWKAPNYGYFDNEKLTIPSPDSYLKQIINNESEQPNFSIKGSSSEYAKISELFTTFEKDILDLMEVEFLNFSRSVYDFNTTLKPTIQGEVQSELANNNFQALMRKAFQLTKLDDNSNPSDCVTKIQEKQISNFEQVLGSFMDFKITMKYGNPSNFDRRLFYTFSNKGIVDPYVFQGYNVGTPNSLPTNGGTITLSQSQTQNPQTWEVLQTYVGFSEIPELAYSDNGSFITDFFIDMNVEFTEESIKTFAPIIKMYATQKLLEPTMNQGKFKTLMDDYLNNNNDYINTFLDIEMKRLRKELPNLSINPTDTKVRANYEGEQTRFELWELFKTINDTWIAGSDFKSKTLFEDVLTLDRASRDVGQQIYVDVFKLKTLLDSDTSNNKMLDIVRTILQDNNFVNFVIPAFANFYNVRDVSKNATPKPEGTLEFANTLFGTFLNVDYRETRSKFICLYANKPSEHLAMNDNVDYRYRDDAFDLRRSTDNPLVEDQSNKTDWSTSNKVVGFNVDIGPQNQQIFKQLDISQDPGQPTSESIEVINQMANLDKNRNSYSQSVSLYNLYKNRSYKCSIDMMGNALIQPMMYFNLRNVPMFSGPYMILKVIHRISRDGFDTTFEGQRQPFYSIPKIESFIQSISNQILKDVQERIKARETETTKSSVNQIKQTGDKLNDVNEKNNLPNVNQVCSKALNESYINFTNLDNLQVNSVNKKIAVETINKLIRDNGTFENEDSKILGAFIYGIMTVATKPNEVFETYGNNYGLIPLNTNYGGSATIFENKYYCNSKNIPMATFGSFEKFVNFMISKYGTQLGIIKNFASTNPNTFDSEKYGKAFAIFYMDNYPTNAGADLFNKLIEENQTKITDIFKKSYTDYLRIQRDLSFGTNTETPKPAKFNPTYNQNDLIQMQINIPTTTIGKWNLDIVKIRFTQKPDECDATLNVEIDVSSYISPDKQSFTMQSQDFLTAIGCSAEGLYSISFEVKSNPVLQDGTTIDTTRSVATQQYNITPNL